MVDLTGNRYGRIVVLSFAGRDSHRRARWLIKCDCGTEKVITNATRVKSCGCSRRQKKPKPAKKEPYLPKLDWRDFKLGPAPMSASSRERRASMKWSMDRLRKIDECRAKGIKLVD